MIQKTKIEIIEETANFYNLENRAVSANGCVYKTLDGRMCAVGRCLRDDFKPYKNKEYGVQAIFESNQKDDTIFFKEEYVGHDVKFWTSLQKFHDDVDNFTTEGLSKKGIDFKNSLINTYK